MKSRNREINIFNMSLLDILCGALGAFCFLMLVLFPYYTPGARKNSKAPEIPNAVDPKTFEEAQARIRQLEELAQKYKEYSQQLEQQVEQLKQQAGKNGDRMEQLEMRNPIYVTSVIPLFDPEDDVEIAIEDDRVSIDRATGKPLRGPLKLNPNRREELHFLGDGQLGGASVPFGVYSIRDAPPGDYRVVLKVLKHNPAAGPLKATIISDNPVNTAMSPQLQFNVAKGMFPIAKITLTKDSVADSFTWTFSRDLLVDKNWQPPQPPKPTQTK